MASPRSQIREGTRVVLREITATLHNSPPLQSLRRKSGNESSPGKPVEQEVKVRFAREFADAGPVVYSTPESISSASSFHSLSSNASTKSSGVCVDSESNTTFDVSNSSYLNNNIAGVDELIEAYAGIRITTQQDNTCTEYDSQDLSQDQTFTSATEETPIDVSYNIVNEECAKEDSVNTTKVIENTSPCLNRTLPLVSEIPQNPEDRPILTTIEFVKEPVVVSSSNNRFVNDSDSQLRTEKSLKKNEDFAGAPEAPRNYIPTLVNDIGSTICNGEDVKSEKAIESLSESKELLESPENFLLDASLNHFKEDLSNQLHKSVTDIISIQQHNSEIDVPSIKIDTSLNTEVTAILSSTDSAVDVNPCVLTSLENIESPTVPNISNISDPKDNTKNIEEDFKLQYLDKETIETLSHRSSSPLECNHEKVTELEETVTVCDSKANTNEEVNACENNCRDLSDKSLSLNEISVAISKSFETPNLFEKSDVCPQQVESKSPNLVPDKLEEPSQQINDHFSRHSSPVCNEKPQATESEETRNDSQESLLFIKSETTTEPKIINPADDTYKIHLPTEELDKTITVDDVSVNLESAIDVEQYEEFKPQRQSTSLSIIDAPHNLNELELATEEVTDDFFKSPLEFTEESDCFSTVTSEVFQDPSSFDFLLARSNSNNTSRLRAESLYIKFDPLVSNVAMLPQENSQPLSEEQNGKSESPVSKVGTPKRNPAIAAIDRLLFFSPIPNTTISESNEIREKNDESVQESKSDSKQNADINVSKELELVRATVLQLEDELEKQKKEYETELKKQKTAFQEKIAKLQTQLSEEIETKNKLTVVVEEYEKSISRLLTENEKQEQEKAKLQEELQATNHHLTNTEAAFNDVHLKYERLKGVVSVYKSNEGVLKESIQENLETIKSLENRYEQLKTHAMSQLKKANLELADIRKQHEAETVKLHAMVKKAELKSNSLAEMVEQKTKENKELTQILDEVIARVGHQNTE